MKKPNIEDVKVGMVFKVTSKQFGPTLVNYARVTRRPYFHQTGDRSNIFSAIFVHPKNFKKIRMLGDQEFSVWFFDYDGKYQETWERVK